MQPNLQHFNQPIDPHTGPPPPQLPMLQSPLERSVELQVSMADSYRLAELNAPEPPQYSRWTRARLQWEMKQRKMPISGLRLKLEYVQVLQSQFDRMHEEYTRYRADQEVRMRPDLMLDSTFGENPTRPSFLGLPAEIRNMAYDLALFEDLAGDYANNMNWVFVFEHGRFIAVPATKNRGMFTASDVDFDRTLSVIHLLSSMNRQVGREVQAFYWGQINITLLSATHKSTKYHQLIHDFLSELGANGRDGLAKLAVPMGFMYRERNEFLCLSRTLTRLGDCKNLRDLRLCVSVAAFYGASDRDVLESYFEGEPLDISCLDTMVGALQELPKLQYLQLNASQDADLDLNMRYNDNFFTFASTGSRKQRLLHDIEAHIGTQLPKVTVDIVGSRDRVENFREWRACHDSRYEL